MKIRAVRLGVTAAEEGLLGGGFRLSLGGEEVESFYRDAIDLEGARAEFEQLASEIRALLDAAESSNLLKLRIPNTD